MSVSYDVTSTLRANTKHHEPIIVEVHGRDSRWKIIDGNVTQSLTAASGTGGAMCR